MRTAIPLIVVCVASAWGCGSSTESGPQLHDVSQQLLRTTVKIGDLVGRSQNAPKLNVYQTTNGRVWSIDFSGAELVGADGVRKEFQVLYWKDESALGVVDVATVEVRDNEGMTRRPEILYSTENGDPDTDGGTGKRLFAAIGGTLEIERINGGIRLAGRSLALVPAHLAPITNLTVVDGSKAVASLDVEVNGPFDWMCYPTSGPSVSSDTNTGRQGSSFCNPFRL